MKSLFIRKKTLFHTKFNEVVKILKEAYVVSILKAPNREVGSVRKFCRLDNFL